MINTPRNIPKPPTMIIANKIVPKDVQAVEIEEEESSVSVLERVMKKKPVVNSDDETIVMEDYFSLSRNNYDEFDKKARTKGNGYTIPSYPFVEAKLEGLEAGLYLFSGESNSGKSAAMMNII